MYDEAVIENGRRVADAALDDVLGRIGEERAVVMQAVAGGGKSEFVVNVTGATRQHRRRVAVCAPTNNQAFDLVNRIARRHPAEQVTFVPASTVALPGAIA